MGVVRLGEAISRLGAVAAFELLAGARSFDPATPTPPPPRKGEGRGRSILKTIPFPRLRLAGDNTKLHPRCQTLSVMAVPGLDPGISPGHPASRTAVPSTSGSPAQGR